MCACLFNELIVRFKDELAQDMNLGISDANCSRGYPMMPRVTLLLDEVVINTIFSKSPP